MSPLSLKSGAKITVHFCIFVTALTYFCDKESQESPDEGLVVAAAGG
jgi:hypothetical protein